MLFSFYTQQTYSHLQYFIGYIFYLLHQMDTVKRIEEKLDKVFEAIEKKEKEIEDMRKITKQLYEELLKVKNIKYGQANSKRS